MPLDTNTSAVPVARPTRWPTARRLAAARLHAGQVRRWIKNGFNAALDPEWTASKSSRSVRRPVWE